MNKRFTREGHRFVVTANSCRVYKRSTVYDAWGDIQTERAVSTQKRVGMCRKYASAINEARQELRG